MAYTETTTTSYGGRLSRSLKGIVGGLIAFIAGTALLFWNEGNYVKTYKALNEAQDATIAVDSVAERDPAPVSYTHLDVYKRQWQSSYARGDRAGII